MSYNILYFRLLKVLSCFQTSRLDKLFRQTKVDQVKALLMFIYELGWRRD